MKTHALLVELMHYQSKSQTRIIFDFLDEMDDVEYSKVPTLLFTPDTLRVLNCYANKITINRKVTDTLDSRVDTFYHIGNSVFRVIV
jgi:hypothetical protein